MIGQRIRELRKECSLSQSALASQLFVSHQAVGKWERDESTPNPEAIVKMANIFGVSTDVLLGEVSRPAPSSPNGVMVPVLGDVAGGIPMLAQENIIDYEEVSKDLTACGDIMGLRVNGHSMEPRICDGDVVIVRRQGDADTGDVAVVLVNGDKATVKKIKKDADGSIWLIPNNPAFEAKHYSPQEQHDLPVTIIGKVVELRGKF
ncbi:S24 family peptidase [Oscillibacter sp.]|uniref:LexA family protein n=1 Tax=Oscillibacter sp. TaxID=1945593 RepID=UPI00339ADE3E